MPSGKARFRGSGAWKEPERAFSETLRNELRELCPADAVSVGFAKETDADRFVNEVLMAASWAFDELDAVQSAITKADLVAEHRNLEAQLQGCRDKLQSVSPELVRLLGVSERRQTASDAIALLLDDFQVARGLLTLPSSALNKELRSKAEMGIAEEMAIRVLQAAKPYGVVVALTDGTFHRGEASLSLRILKLIGDDIGLRRTLPTWRRIVSEAKKNNPEL